MTHPPQTSPTTRVWRWLIVLSIAMLVAAVGLGGWAYWRHTSRERPSPKQSASAPMPSMVGMNMNANGSILLTPAQLHQFGITFGTVEVRPLTTTLRVPGSVMADERRIAQVATKFAGTIERLYVNATGQPVQRGQPLLEIYSPELVAAQQDLVLSGQLQHDLGTATVPGVPLRLTDLVTTAKERLRLWDISDAQITEILRTGHARRTLTLYAPVAGVVTEKGIVQGQAVMPGTSLYTIADLSVVWVNIDVREADASQIRPGSTAMIELTSEPGRPRTGQVDYVYPTLQPETRTLTARVIVTNTDGHLKPGMYAIVHLSTPQRSALTVPISAILRTGTRNVVFVDIGHGTLLPQDVELGQSAGDYTEVLAGVEPGQRVVTSAQFLLDSESNIGDVMRAMMGQMSTSDNGMRDMQTMSDMPGMNMKMQMQMPRSPATTAPRR